MAEENNISKQVKEALTTSKDQIVLETIQSENNSPLITPVIEKDIGGESQVNLEQENQPWNIWKPTEQGDVSELQDDVNYREAIENQIESEKKNEPLDAPEQEINGNDEFSEQDTPLSDTDFEMPLSQANQTADALLGITNNLLTAGASFFVKVKKHEQFYEFNEIVDVIDEQNEKNVQRILLDKEDKALLRPLLSEVIRKKAKQLTPEQQLMGAVASILIKKGQTVMEIRAENKNLENRLITIIKEQKKQSEPSIVSNDYKEDFNLEEQEITKEKELSSEQVDDDPNSVIAEQSDVVENSIVEYADEP